MQLKDLEIDGNWTLFLDRDGVINYRYDGDYVRNWKQFKFLEGVLNAASIFNQKFGKIIVVTNQQGIGKGLYTHDDLADVHQKMKIEFENNKGRIDGIYYSPYLKEENHITRKPDIGMALLAKEHFPNINFQQSIMVGDSQTDIQFGRNAGMKTVYLHPKLKNPAKADFVFKDLKSFAEAL